MRNKPEEKQTRRDNTHPILSRTRLSDSERGQNTIVALKKILTKDVERKKNQTESAAFSHPIDGDHDTVLFAKFMMEAPGAAVARLLIHFKNDKTTSSTFRPCLLSFLPSPVHHPSSRVELKQSARQNDI